MRAAVAMGVSPHDPLSMLALRDDWPEPPKPAWLPMHEAACLNVAWGTAYRMLFTRAAARPGESVLVQGAGGGVATAAIMLARAAGLHVVASRRSPAKRERAIAIGAHEAIETGWPAAAACRPRRRDGGRRRPGSTA